MKAPLRLNVMTSSALFLLYRTTLADYIYFKETNYPGKLGLITLTFLLVK